MCPNDPKHEWLLRGSPATVQLIEAGPAGSLPPGTTATPYDLEILIDDTYSFGVKKSELKTYKSFVTRCALMGFHLESSAHKRAWLAWVAGEISRLRAERLARETGEDCVLSVDKNGERVE